MREGIGSDIPNYRLGISSPTASLPSLPSSGARKVQRKPLNAPATSSSLSLSVWIGLRVGLVLSAALAIALVFLFFEEESPLSDRQYTRLASDTSSQRPHPAMKSKGVQSDGGGDRKRSTFSIFAAQPRSLPSAAAPALPLLSNGTSEVRSVTLGSAESTRAKTTTPFLAVNRFGYRAIAFMSQAIVEIKDGLNQSHLEFQIAAMNNTLLKLKMFYDGSHNHSAPWAEALDRAIQGCAGSPSSNEVHLSSPSFSSILSTPMSLTPDVLGSLSSPSSFSSVPLYYTNRERDAEQCLTFLFFQLNGDQNERNRRMVRHSRWNPKSAATRGVQRRKVTDAIKAEKMLESFLALPSDDSKALPPRVQYHLEASLGVVLEAGEGGVGETKSAAVTSNSSSFSSSSPSSSSLAINNAVQQCIRNAHTVSVLTMDVESLRLSDSGERRTNTTTTLPPVSPSRSPSSPPPSLPQRWDRHTKSSVLRDANMSHMFETAYSFSNKELFMDGTVEGLVGLAAETEKQKQQYVWDHAMFHDGPPSDADDFLVDPIKFASAKVPWVRGNGRQSAGQPEESGHHYNFWGDYDDELHDGNPPCTQYVQHRLHALMNPRDCGAAGEEDDRGFPDLRNFSKRSAHAESADPDASQPQTAHYEFDPFDTIAYHNTHNRNALGQRRYHRVVLSGPPVHGVGSSMQMESIIFLVGLRLNRIALSQSDGNKRFASAPCKAVGRHGTECYWQRWSRCQYRMHNITAPICTSRDCNMSVLTGVQRENEFTSSTAWASGVRRAMPHGQFFGEAFIRGIRRISPETSRAVDVALNVSLADQRSSKKNKCKKGTPPPLPVNRSAIPRCYQRYKQWAKDPRNDEFTYMQAQALRYITRYQQPWFHNMLAQHLRDAEVDLGARETSLGEVIRRSAEKVKAVALQKMKGAGGGNADSRGSEGETVAPAASTTASSSSSSVTSSSSALSFPNDPIIFLHERGEPAKFVENRCFFSCHRVDSDFLINLTFAYCKNLHDHEQRQQITDNSSSSTQPSHQQPKCQVYLSGNIPPTAYRYLLREFGAAEGEGGGGTAPAAVKDAATSSVSLPVSAGVNATNASLGVGSNSANNSNTNNKNGLFRSIRSTWNLGANTKRRLKREEEETAKRLAAAAVGVEEKNIAAAAPSTTMAAAPSAKTALGSRNTSSSASSSSSSSAAAVSVSAKYGATSLAAGWVDMYAGAASSHWICVSSSNWCGMMTKMRMVSGRGVCQSFFDLDRIMHQSQTLRERYCVVDHRYGGCRG